MRIEIGRYAGFCRGVKHAVNGAFACAREVDGEVLTDGELIHNPQTLELLSQHNVRVMAPETDPGSLADKVVVIRAHGVPLQRLRDLRGSAREVRNLTCRDVAKVQAIVKKAANRGRSVVIFGKPSHPEVQGLLGYAGDGHVVTEADDVAALPELEDPLMVSQTTMSQEAFATVSQLLRDRFPGAEVVNTICDATELRQNEVRELARRNDCVLVIGSSTSSNTRRLHEIASDFTTSHLVTDIDDVRSLDFSGVRRLGVTAGASTPDWLIHEIVEEVRRATVGAPRRLVENTIRFLIYSKLFVAGGAYLLSYAVADNIGLPFSPDIALLAAMYYLAMSLLNTYTSRSSTRLDDQRRHRFMHRYRGAFLALFVAALAVIAGLSTRLGTEVVALTLFSLVLGIAYNMSYLPLANARQRIFFVRKRVLLALKSVVISVAVTVLLNGLPLLKHYPKVLTDLSTASQVLGGLGFYFSLYYVFMLMFMRQALFEIKTAQSDRIAGVSSLLNLIRVRHITWLLYLLPTILLLAMAIGTVVGLYPAAKMKYFVAVGYNYLLVLLARNRRVVSSQLGFELLVESNVWVAGLVALV
jgi:4-hydroxy-3-methylbut-2-enyl diphosphate reductase